MAYIVTAPPLSPESDGLAPLHSYGLHTYAPRKHSCPTGHANMCVFFSRLLFSVDVGLLAAPSPCPRALLPRILAHMSARMPTCLLSATPSSYEQREMRSTQHRRADVCVGTRFRMVILSSDDGPRLVATLPYRPPSSSYGRTVAYRHGVQGRAH